MVARLTFIVFVFCFFSGCAGNGGERQEPSEELGREAENLVGKYKFQWERDSAETAAIYARNIARGDSFMREYNRGKDEFGAYGYLQPSEYPGLPQPIAFWLENRGYMIPQILSPFEYEYSPELKYQNAITGEFKKSGQEDWAVYCSIDTSASIIIFYDQDTLDYQQIIFLPDSTRIRCCDLSISRAEEYMIQDEPSYKELKTSYPAIDHVGIYISTAHYPLDLIYEFKGNWIRMSPFYD